VTFDHVVRSYSSVYNKSRREYNYEADPKKIWYLPSPQLFPQISLAQFR